MPSSRSLSRPAPSAAPKANAAAPATPRAPRRRRLTCLRLACARRRLPRCDGTDGSGDVFTARNEGHLNRRSVAAGPVREFPGARRAEEAPPRSRLGAFPSRSRPRQWGLGLDPRRAVPLWYRMHRPICPECPPTWTMGTKGTPRGASLPLARRLGAERSLVQIQSPRLPSHQLREQQSSRASPILPAASQSAVWERCFAWKAAV